MIYEIGGNEVKVDANEGFASIANNRTLFIQQLTNKAPLRPEIVDGLTSVEAVFEHFKPSVELELELEDGVTQKEKLFFTNVGDFNPKNLVQNSSSLNSINDAKMAYIQILKQIQTNKLLQHAVSTPDNKEALLHTLEALAKELQSANQE